MLRSREIFTVALLAPVAYAFFYPQPYIEQAPRHLPVAVVDQDTSAYSRHIVSYVSAEPSFRLTMVGPSQRDALAALGAGTIVGYLVVPPRLERKILGHRQAHVVAVGNASYPLLDSTALSGFAEAIASVNGELAATRRRSLLVSNAGAAAQA